MTSTWDTPGIRFTSCARRSATSIVSPTLVPSGARSVSWNCALSFGGMKPPVEMPADLAEHEERADAREDDDPAELHRPAEDRHVGALDRLVDDVDHAMEERRRRVRVVPLEQARAEHRGEGERDEERHADRRCHRQAEALEEAADDAVHERDRDQHAHQRERRREDREADLPCRVDRGGERLYLGFSMKLMMFSMTTIASSMTRPTASASASSVRKFSVKPNRYITANVPTIEMGIASAAMAVLRALPGTRGR